MSRKLKTVRKLMSESNPGTQTITNISKNRFRSQLRLRIIVAASLAVIFLSQSALGQLDLNSEPILYQSSKSTDKVAQLIKKLESGEVELNWEETHGWLPDLLKKLDVDAQSQTLVFSKTSLQIRHISPSNPRAIYFNDDVYVGSVPGGDIIEVAAVDKKIGPVFYSLKHNRTSSLSKPEFARDENQCMTCHATSKTKNVPGFLVRSVFASGSGHPHYGMGTLTTDHTTPLKKRFGGWYVTGKHGPMVHRGNVIARRDPRDPIDYEKGANLLDLPKRVRIDNYLVPTSDIVALMVLEQQSQVHNAITRANYETRRALYQQAIMNRALERPDDFQSESTLRRIRSVADELLAHLFYCDEYALECEISGNSKFSDQWQKLGPFDSKGRSLRQLDMKSRMFKYPLSYLVYSESYNSMPTEVLEIVEQKMIDILTNVDVSRQFSHLSRQARSDILEILVATKPSFAARVSKSKSND